LLGKNRQSAAEKEAKENKETKKKRGKREQKKMPFYGTMAEKIQFAVSLQGFKALPQGRGYKTLHTAMGAFPAQSAGNRAFRSNLFCGPPQKSISASIPCAFPMKTFRRLY
jgi:hypothetical protein